MTKLLDLFWEVFPEYKERLIALARKYRILLFIMGAICVIAYLSCKFPGHRTTVTNLLKLVDTSFWIGMISILLPWSLTLLIIGRLSSPDPAKFVEDFSRDLKNWQYEGYWQLETMEGRRVLTVTNSEDGGTASPCTSWRDYVFEFDMKLINARIGWLVRARDLDNCVMLQLRQTEIMPHFRHQGKWYLAERVPLQFEVPLRTWFHVRIEVRGERIVAMVRLDGKETEVFNDLVLRPGKRKVWPWPANAGHIETLDVSYEYGSPGFRTWDNEQALFKNIKVTRIGGT
jgi:hypothetical protein